MRDLIEIRGDFKALLELSKELKAQSIDSEVCYVAMQSIEGGEYNVLEVAGSLTAVALVFRAYLKHRRGHITLEVDGKKLEIEAKTTEETEQLLRSGVHYLRLLDDKKEDATNS